MSDPVFALDAIEVSKGAVRKFERGVKLASSVRSQIEEFIDESNRRILYTSLLDGKHHIWSIEFEKELSSDLPLTLGDAIHNWRSSLDHVANALTCWAGETTNHQTEFPLGASFHYLRNVSSSHCANRIVESHQPAGRVAGTEGSPSDEPLYWLHRLDIVDKHRSLIFAAPGIDMIKLDLPRPGMRVELTGWRVLSTFKWEFLARSEQSMNLDGCASFDLYVGLPHGMTQNDLADTLDERPNLNVFLMLDDIEGNVRQVLMDCECLVKLGGVMNECPRLALRSNTDCESAGWSCITSRVLTPISLLNDESR